MTFSNSTFTVQNSFKNFLWVTIGNILTRVLSFSILIYLARTIDPFRYGQVQWAWAIVSVAMILSDFGLQPVGIRMVAQQKISIKNILSDFVALKFLFTVAVFSGLLLFLIHIPDNDTKKITIIFGFSLFANVLFMDWFFIGANKLVFISISKLLHYTIYVVFVIITVHNPDDFLFAPVGCLVGLLSAVIFLNYVYLKNNLPFKIKINTGQWLNILKQSTPIGVSALIVQIYTNVPIIVVGWLKGGDSIAYFSSAYRLVQVLLEFLFLFFFSLYPLAANKFIEDPEKLEKILTFILRFVTLLTFPLVIIGIFIGPDVFIFLMGSKFELSILPLRILLWNLVAVGINGVYAQLVLLMKGKQKEYLICISFGALISLAANSFLIPLFGYVGAAIGSVIAELAVGVAAFYYGRKYLKADFQNIIWKPIVSSLIMAGAILSMQVIHIQLIVQILTGLLIYTISSFLLKAISSEDIVQLKWYFGMKNAR